MNASWTATEQLASKESHLESLNAELIHTLKELALRSH
jgi:hypothetical protein